VKRLLLVEDDASLGETLQERLAKEGYSVRWVDTQKDAEKSFEAESFDLVILDVGLPDGSGFDLARKLPKVKKGCVPTPFLFITAMNTAEHRLEGYELGAEEFIPKPFHLKELLIRVRHVLETHSSSHEVRINDCVIDLVARTVAKDGGENEFLQTRDFELLKLLIEAAPRVVSRDEILDAIWGEDKFPSQRTVDNAIVRLRQAIGDTDGGVIRSARGIGYQWVSAGPRQE
jgi:DNA-binding response OmpR family regulator